MSSSDDESAFAKALNRLIYDINQDQYMLMEFLIPVVDGCRAALNVKIGEAKSLDNVTEEQFQQYMDTTVESYKELVLGITELESDEKYYLVFDEGQVSIEEEVDEPNVVILAPADAMISILDADPKISIAELLKDQLQILAHDPQDAIEAIGFLCFPELQRVARSGADPTNLESEDADTIITQTATELVTGVLKHWIDIQLSNQAMP